MVPRLDFVFSYWIFAWWILYTVGVTTFNPKLVLILSIIENSLGLFFLPREKILFYLVINLFIKVIPLCLVWNTKVNQRDIVFTCVLFLIYLAWVKLNGVDMFKRVTPITDWLLRK
jgi:hypothetical protein